jgi:ketosteroid isomerase-like protein
MCSQNLIRLCNPPRAGYAGAMSEKNVAIVRALFEAGDGQSKEAVLAALPEVVPTLFHPDAEWTEAPERVDAKSYRGHAGIRRSFELWLAQWSEYRLEAERFEDHGDDVLVIAREHTSGQESGVTTTARIYAVLTFRDTRISRYREFYDEAAARATIG